MAPRSSCGRGITCTPITSPTRAAAGLNVPQASAEHLSAGFRAYNRWLADFRSVAPERWLGMAAVSFHDLEAAVTDRTKILLFVSPSTPTGAVYRRQEIEEIGRWAVARGLWVITDEIYEHLVYGSAEHHSMPVVVPEIAQNCLVVNGVAKTYAMTGWRVGWLIGPPDAVAAATNLQSHQTSNVANVSQAAALCAVSGDLSAVRSMRDAFDRRRKTMVGMLNEIEGVECVEPEGAFYAFPSVKGLLGKDIAGRRSATSAELADLCITEAKVAVVPGEAFGAPGYFRMSYALGDEDLAEGVTRLATLFGQAK